MRITFHLNASCSRSSRVLALGEDKRLCARVDRLRLLGQTPSEPTLQPIEERKAPFRSVTALQRPRQRRREDGAEEQRLLGRESILVSVPLEICPGGIRRWTVRPR